MDLFTSLDVKLKIWRGPTSEMCGRNSVGGHFDNGRCNSVIRQFSDNSGQIIHL